VITRFEPWMALSFSEGSIGGDIERISLKDLEAFYAKEAAAHVAKAASTHVAKAASARARKATSVHVTPLPAGEGGRGAPLNRVENATSAAPRPGEGRATAQIETPYAELTGSNGIYKTSSGMAKKVFTVYRTHHGPIVREADGKWISVRLMQDPMHALIQSYTRTKASDFKSFLKTMELHTNSSNNTIFADADGDIAYFNRRHKRVGHLFQGRFKGLLVERETYLLTCARYIVLNPVEAHIVDRPALRCWRWVTLAAGQAAIRSRSGERKRPEAKMNIPVPNRMPGAMIT
jgi:REP element-mobilizing transposase RayT